MNLKDLPRINVAQLRELAGAKRQTRRKYANVPTSIGDLDFDSRAEAKRWAELELMQKAGQIRNLRRQVPYELIPSQKRPSGGTERACTYVADFCYDEAPHWRTVVADTKGFSTPEYRIKRKLMLHVHGIEVREFK